MSRKTYIRATDPTKKRWASIAREVHAECLDQEKAGHETKWSQDELFNILRQVLQDRELDPDKRMRSWWRKVCFASLSLDDVFALDMDTSNQGGPKFFWRRDGQMPSGMLRHMASAAKGFVVPLFDYAWGMAQKHSADELVAMLGAETALFLVVSARLGAYQEITIISERAPVIAVLHGLEDEVAAMMATPALEAVFDEIFTPLLAGEVHLDDDSA